jgi:hypothetical protein
MRAIILATATALAACGGQGTTVPVPEATPRPAPRAAGGPTPAEQAAREMRMETRDDVEAARLRAVDPQARRPTGEPRPDPYDIGAQGQLPAMPEQVSPIFRRQ